MIDSFKNKIKYIAGKNKLNLSINLNKDISTKYQARRGQGELRDYLLKYNGKCEICGLSHKKFLITSHIKPWSESIDEEKRDPNNCFLLCPDHDALFDKGYITLKERVKS